MELYLYAVCGNETCWILPFGAEQEFTSIDDALSSPEPPLQADELAVDADTEFGVLEGLHALQGVARRPIFGDEARSIIITRDTTVAWHEVLRDAPSVFAERLGTKVTLRVMMPVTGE